MKSILLSILLFSFGAQAAITNLPKELKGLNYEEGNILQDVADEMSSEFACDLTPKQLLSLKADFVLVHGELQDEEYKEYDGELSAFNVETTVELPSGCNKVGKYTCSNHFDLYDEKSYEVDRTQSSCKKAN